jgi:hypothetical protein
VLGRMPQSIIHDKHAPALILPKSTVSQINTRR